MKTSGYARAGNPRAQTVRLLAAGIVLAACVTAARADWPNDPVEGLVSTTGDKGAEGSIGMDAAGRFIAAYQMPRVSPQSGADIWVYRFDDDGTPIGLRTLLTVRDGENMDSHKLPSLAISADGIVQVAWVGHRYLVSNVPDSLLASRFEFDLDPFAPTPLRPPPTEDATYDYEPSSGIAPEAVDSATAAWARLDPEDTHGLLWDATTAPLLAVRACDTGGGGDVCFAYESGTYRPTAWQPSVCQRSDGTIALVFADAEEPDAPDSPFNIRIGLIQENGTVIGDPDFTLVNVPSDEVEGSTQKSAAVAFDDWGNIVCVWVGPNLDGCSSALAHIYVRRYTWDGNVLHDPVPISAPLRINSDSNAEPLAPKHANPTVALTLDPENAGAFIVAWNVEMYARTWHNEIHAQYIGADGTPVGGEFRVNQDVSETGTDVSLRRLANSAQHTLDYGPDGQVVAAWTAYSSINPSLVPVDAHYTLLPPGYAETLPGQCCKADINADGLRNGLDIQPFVDLLLGDGSCLNILELCPADMNNDASITTDDIPSFVYTILDGAECSTRSGGQGLEDCNGNDIPDANDINDCPPEDPSCQDCNANWAPDECDIAAETSADVNSNGIPDECDPDCNGNNVPDDQDIADETSDDIDSNGVPDECQPDCNKNGIPDDWDIDPEDPDGNELVSADCNENDVPDECEADCNANGVPDDCDIDPADPDGDEWVSPDCNANEFPDECDIALGPGFGSTDCNDNDIPDECDIADCDPEDPDCQDCNANGYPDSCDIAAEISLDEDENGIPDECEEQFLMGGGMMMGEGLFGGEGFLLGDPEEGLTAWIEYYEWLDEQDWGPDSELTGAEQFQLMVDKLKELGLPIQSP